MSETSPNAEIVGVLLFNLGDKDFEVNEGDRIAQLVIERIMPTTIYEATELPTTVRGEGGFGSTGVTKQMNHKAPETNHVNGCKLSKL